jgi:hypothetical protein
MKILNVADREFYTYGRVIEGLDVSSGGFKGNSKAG